MSSWCLLSLSYGDSEGTFIKQTFGVGMDPLKLFVKKKMIMGVNFKIYVFEVFGKISKIKNAETKYLFGKKK